MVDDHEDFIRVYEGALKKDETRRLIKDLRQLFARGFGHSRQAAGGRPKYQQDDQQIFEIRDADPRTAELGDRALAAAAMPALQAGLQSYVREFDILTDLDLVGWNVKAQLTRKGEGYHVWHFESSSFHFARRVLAWTIYLNDDFEGGELEFLYYGRRYRPKAGDLVIFPGAFTHAHRGNMVLGGEKLILTGWWELIPEGLSADG